MWGENVTAHIVNRHQKLTKCEPKGEPNSRQRERQHNKGDSNMNFTDHRNNKKLQDYMSRYNREVEMSEYVTIPKSRLRRLIITEVLAWGITAFILLISLFH